MSNLPSLNDALMKLQLLIVLANICLLIGACDPTDKKFVINNISPKTKSYYITNDSTKISAIKFYSEKFYINSENKKITKEYDYLKSDTKSPIDVLGTWEKYLDNQFKDGIAYIYIIDSSYIGREAELLRENNAIKQFKVTSVYLKKNNWELLIK